MRVGATGVVRTAWEAKEVGPPPGLGAKVVPGASSSSSDRSQFIGSPGRDSKKVVPRSTRLAETCRQWCQIVTNEVSHDTAPRSLATPPLRPCSPCQCLVTVSCSMQRSTAPRRAAREIRGPALTASASLSLDRPLYAQSARPLSSSSSPLALHLP